MTDQVRLPRLYLAWLTPRLLRARRRGARRGRRRCSPAARTRGSTSAWSTTRRWRRTSSAYQQSGALGSSFLIVATARPGHTVAEMQKAIDEELERLRREPPSAREVQRALNQIEASFYRRMERVGGFGGKADQLNAYYAAGGGPDFFAEDLARYTSLSPSDVQAAVARVAAGRPARRAGRRAGGEEMSDGSGSRLRLQARWHWLAALVVVLIGSATSFAQERPDRSQAAGARAGAAADAAADSEARRSPTACRCGSSRRTKCRSCRSTWSCMAGSGDDPAGKFGVASLTAAMLDEGAGTRSGARDRRRRRVPRRGPRPRPARSTRRRCG